MKTLLVLAAIVAIAGCPASAMRKNYRVREAAREAAETADLSRADELYGKLRKRVPKSPEAALEHASVLARQGNDEAALTALEDAIRLGLRSRDDIENDSGLSSIRSTPRYAQALEAAEENDVRFKHDLAAARRPLDPAQAPAFASFEALEAAHEHAEKSFYRKGGDEPYAIRRARFQEEWAAALARLADERRGTPDRERALIGIVRLRLGDTVSIEFAWPEDDARRVQAAAAAFLAEFPESPMAAEARLADAAATAAGVVPVDYDWLREALPSPRCDEARPALEELSRQGTADPWSGRALGFSLLCRIETDNAAAIDGFRDDASAVLKLLEADRERDVPYDFLLRSGLMVASWRLDGLPAFEAEGLTTPTVTLEDFKGKVTLLDFWSPT